MPLSLTESQAVTDLAGFLYDFLPGKPHPYADQTISFAGVAHSLGLAECWIGGSKLPAITALLERTLETRRDCFCQLMVGIVRKGIAYRHKKGNAITREEIRQLNDLVAKVHFKIPELWDPKFLDTLPSAFPAAPEQTGVSPDTNDLKAALIELKKLSPQTRGFAFEKFLNQMFNAFDLDPRSPFLLVGEQIDGSFELDHEIYLLEAKWHDSQTSQSDMLVLREKVEAKATWSRGLFVSHSGFTKDGLEAFSRGRATNLIGMTGQDLYFILEGKMSLPVALRRKIRLAGETGRFYVSVQEISLANKP